MIVRSENVHLCNSVPFAFVSKVSFDSSIRSVPLNESVRNLVIINAIAKQTYALSN